jgi:site-specific DNA recombinase
MKEAAIYVRVSTDEQAKGYSLNTQVDACKAYADEKGYKVIGIFSDDYTGAALDRPALNQLRDYMVREPVDVIVVYDIDRLARKSAYQVLIEEEFKRAGAVIEYVMEQYEDTDEGRLQKQIKGVIAEYEKAKIMERSKRGKRGKAKSGFVVVGSRPPYGYKVKSEPHKAWFEIDEDEAAIVRMIFDMYINGNEKGVPMSARSIAKRLTQLGIPTRADTQRHFGKKFGKCIWQGVTIMGILSNETYIGTWHFGKTKVIDNNNYREFRSKRSLNRQIGKSSRDQWIPVSVPAIIDNESFVLAQKRRNTNRKMLSGRAKRGYLMKGRLTCAKCGYAVYGHASSHNNYQYSYYICSGREQVIGLCDMPSMSADWVDTVVWNWVRGIIENTDNLRDGLQESQAQLEQEHRTLFERLSIIDEQIQDYQKQLNRLLDLYLSGEFPKEVLTEHKIRLEEMLSNLRNEQNDLSAYIRNVSITDAQLSYIEAFAAKIRDGIDVADFYAKRQIIELLDIHGKIAVENGEKVIYLKCLIDLTGDNEFSEVKITQTFYLQ